MLLRIFVIELPRSPLINLDFKTELNFDKVIKLQNLGFILGCNSFCVKDKPYMTKLLDMKALYK